MALIPPGAKLELGQVAFLEVTALSSFGAFVDWGLPKELLVPSLATAATASSASRIE